MPPRPRRCARHGRRWREAEPLLRRQQRDGEFCKDRLDRQLPARTGRRRRSLILSRNRRPATSSGRCSVVDRQTVCGNRNRRPVRGVRQPQQSARQTRHHDDAKLRPRVIAETPRRALPAAHSPRSGDTPPARTVLEPRGAARACGGSTPASPCHPASTPPAQPATHRRSVLQNAA